jgi:proline dehydrogenase
MNFNRNGSMNNMHNVEKTMQKFQQLAKDAQSNGDPVLAQNYLQHADHYLRRFNELNERKENSIEKIKVEEKPTLDKNEQVKQELLKTTN